MIINPILREFQKWRESLFSAAQNKHPIKVDILRKPQNFVEITHFVLMLQSDFKKGGSFLSIFVAFSQYLNFNTQKASILLQH